MRVQSGETPGDDQSAAENEADERVVDDSTTLRPTFTPAPREADDDAVPGDMYAQTPTAVEPAEDSTDAETDEPAHKYETSAAATAEPVTAAPTTAGAPPAPVASADLDQPLLSEDPELLARWHQVQLEFIDNPQVAVVGAADIVEQVGRTLVDALQQRQRQMRAMWDHSSAAPGDTEQLRQVMQRYRALFNQLTSPSPPDQPA